MNKANEQRKIRETLKSVYELYEKDKIYNLIFTTYNYDPAFFEEHIIAYLMGFDKKISTIGELKEADQWIRKNHVSVYYDKNALKAESCSLTIPIYPQNIKHGVFHPKVIVIYGKQKNSDEPSVHLFVSSCNLTVNGYGRNMEAFACVEVSSKQLAKSLSNFLKSLSGDNNLTELLNHLENITVSKSEVEFLWTYPNTDPQKEIKLQGIKLIEYLKNNSSGDLTVISPYFDNNGPKDLLDALPNKTTTTIVPSIDGMNYNIHRNDYNDLISNDKIKFKEFKNDQPPRFIHAKIIKFGQQIIIGSYNFTTAALRGNNAEAALLFNNINSLSFNLTDKLIPVTENKFYPDGETISNKDEASLKENNLFVRVSVNWKIKKIDISAEGLNDENNYNLKIDGYNTGWTLKEHIEDNISIDLETTLLKNKTFSVYNMSNNTRCYRGLINEFDSNFRPELSYENLEESLREWYTNTKENNNRPHYQKLINPEDIETEEVLNNPKDETADIFDNYYLVAKAFENLLSHIQASDKEIEIYNFLVTNPGSIRNMINFLKKEYIKKEKAKDLVHIWLITNYLLRTIYLCKKNVESFDSKFCSEEIDSALNTLTPIKDDIDLIISNRVDNSYLQWIQNEFNKDA